MLKLNECFYDCYLLSVIGYWSVVASFFGYLLSVIGYWLLVIGLTGHE